jgi:hypothetical protein
VFDDLGNAPRAVHRQSTVVPDGDLESLPMQFGDHLTVIAFLAAFIPLLPAAAAFSPLIPPLTYIVQHSL